MVMIGYNNARLQVLLVDIKHANIVEIFTSRKHQEIFASNIIWIDNTTFYYHTYSNKNANKKFNAWLVDISAVDEQTSLSFKKSRVNANGYVIDALKHKEDTLLFGAYLGKKHKLKIYETHTDSLLKNNFKHQKQRKTILKDARWYGTDHEHNIRFSSIYDEDEHLLAHWYLDDDEDWQKYYEFDPSKHTFLPIGFLNNGKLAVITNVDSDLASLYEFDVHEKAFGKLLYSHEHYDLIDAEYNSKALKISSVTYLNEGEEHTEYFNDSDKSLYELTKDTFTGQQIIEVAQNADNTIKIIFVYSSNNIGQYYYFNTITKTAIYLGDKKEFANEHVFLTAKTLHVEGTEGHIIEAYLTQADADIANNVLLVMPHGGPIGVRNDKSFNVELQYLVSRGYTVLQVNFRGSEGYGKAYKNSGRGQFGKIIEEDISSVVDYVIENYNYDKFCAIGASYGAYSSVMLAIKHPDLYQCVVARFGVYDLPLIFNDRNSKFKPSLITRLENVVGKNDAALKDYSPVYFAEKLLAPILITAGKLDTRASFEHSNRMKMALEQKQANFEYIYYPSAKHGHTSYITHRHELVYIDDFIRRKLQLAPPIGTNTKEILQDEYEFLSWGFKQVHIAEKRPNLSRFYSELAKAQE